MEIEKHGKHFTPFKRIVKGMDGLDFIMIGFAALAGGAVNALAGGGTLITFPMLTAVVGIPAVSANVTHTVGGSFIAGKTTSPWSLFPTRLQSPSFRRGLP